MKEIAVKTNPHLWKIAKRQACISANLCKHSARKMQWAVHYYKKNGGKYSGKRSKKNSMYRWTRQKWRTHSGKISNGKQRYLPSKAWNHLTELEIQRTNDAKLQGFIQGKQWVSQPRDISNKTRRFHATPQQIVYQNVSQSEGRETE